MKRLLDETGSPLARALLESSRADAPPDSKARQQTLSALAAFAVAGVMAKTAAGASSSTAGSPGLLGGLSGTLVKWLALGVGVAGAGGGVVWVARSMAEQHAPAVTAAVSTPSMAAPESSSAPSSVFPEPVVAESKPAESVPEAVPQPSPAPATRAHGTRIAPSATATTSTSEPAVPSIRAELAQLQQARMALATGRLADAAEALDRHDREFASGSLAPEATVLRIQLLLARGDRPGARALAERFSATDPQSPYAARARALVGMAP